MKINWKPYAVSIAVALGIGGLSALLTSGSMDIYKTIDTPPLAPPAILFPIVWSILFILMGISAAMIYTDDMASVFEKRSALYPYAVSLIFNFGWSIIFFNIRAFLFAFIWILVLLFLIVRTIMKYKKINPKAAYLQIPYLLWVAFAAYLNAAIWILNR